MALIDGRLDNAKIATVLRYAAALDIDERYLDDIKEAAQGRLQEAMADMTRCNMDSITNRPWPGGDVNTWPLPYRGAAASRRWCSASRHSPASGRNLRARVLDALHRQRLRVPGRSDGA